LIHSELQQEVAGGTRELVAADAESRKDLVAVHRELLSERARLESGWTELERERRRLSGERRTESLLVAALKPAGGLLLVVSVLWFSWYALFSARSDGQVEAELNAFLIDELASGQPLLTSGERPPRIGREPASPADDSSPP
jgi:hypothetical protein